MVSLKILEGQIALCPSWNSDGNCQDDDFHFLLASELFYSLNLQARINAVKETLKSSPSQWSPVLISYYLCNNQSEFHSESAIKLSIHSWIALSKHYLIWPSHLTSKKYYVVKDPKWPLLVTYRWMCINRGNYIEHTFSIPMWAELPYPSSPFFSWLVLVFWGICVQ